MAYFINFTERVTFLYSSIYRFLFKNNRKCWQINITGFIIISKIIGINNFIKIKYLKINKYKILISKN